MTQPELNRVVARLTGESLKEIRRRGFSLAAPEDVHYDPEPVTTSPSYVDWDRLDAMRPTLFPCRAEEATPSHSFR